ncbi:unnamed protein product, partial [Lymnaea stagnalis]
RQLYTVGDSLWLFEEYHHFFPGSLKLSQNSEESCKALDGQGTSSDPSGQGENRAGGSSDQINSLNQIKEELVAGQENKVSEEIGGPQPGTLEPTVCLAANTRTSGSCEETLLVEHSGGVDSESGHSVSAALADECLDERKTDLTDKLLDVEETLQDQPKEFGGGDDVWVCEQDVQQSEINSQGPESEAEVLDVTGGTLKPENDSVDELASSFGQADVSTNHDECNLHMESCGNANFNKNSINSAMAVSDSELSVIDSEMSVTDSVMSVIGPAIAETGSTLPVTDSVMSVASSAMVVKDSDMAVTSSETVVNDAADTTTNTNSDFSEAIKSSYSFSVPYETCSPLGHDLLQMYLQELD